VVLKSYIYKR